MLFPQGSERRQFAGVYRLLALELVEPKLDEILLQDPSKRPTSYHEAVAIATLEGGVLWGIGRGLYDYITHGAVTEAEIRAFAGVCPPFRAACYALVVSWYEIALKLRSPEENSPAGRNDLMMAVYLHTAQSSSLMSRRK